VTPRIAIAAAVTAMLLPAGCRGYDTIAPEEAAWQRIAPALIGMQAAEIERCAAPPVAETAPGPGLRLLRYRAQDLGNYCEIALSVRAGTVVGYTADYDAPEFLWLRDGTNYCGRIFRNCGR